MACGKKPVSLVIKENIEMKVFSSKEPCKVLITQEEEEEHSVHQRYMASPLFSDSEEAPEQQVQTQPRHQAETDSPDQEEPHCSAVVCKQEVEIELEVIPPIRKSKSHPAMPYSNKAGHLKWKRLIPQKKRLVVKDVVCLPRGHSMSQLDRQIVPKNKDQAALEAMMMTARITIDHSWSATHVKGRLAMLFQGHFVKQAGQKFSFTYLQCVQSSRVLFVPDTPSEGWTGEQVLRISEHGALYILSHHDYSETESEGSASETLVVKSTDSCQDGKSELIIKPSICRDTKKSTVDLDTILRAFRQENVDPRLKTHIQVRRTDLLHGALEVVRRPDFCFRATPVISFSGEEPDGHEAPVREFFRLILLELQHSCVFEGLPGSLFMTCNFTALEERKYYEAGVLIGWSLAQGGPGLCCLHPALYQVMCCHSITLEDFNWRDIIDTEVQIQLKELHSCTDVKLLSPSLCDWVSRCGIPEIYSANSDEMPAIYSRLVKHYIYDRVTKMISQFTEGLNSCGGLWDMVQSHWEIFAPVMTSAPQQPLSLEEFKQLFTISFSTSDAQLRADEEATAGHWETILTLVRDGKAEFSFEDLLTFITGADRLPPLGFPRFISLCFYSQDASMQDLRLPHAASPSLELYLPRGVAGAVDLLALLNRAVHKVLRDGEDN